MLVALELLILSNGLPPPLPTFPPSFCVWAPPCAVLVLLVTVDVSTRMPFVDVGVFEVVSGVVLCRTDVRSVLVGFPGTFVSVRTPLVTGVAEERTIVLCPIDAVIDTVVGLPPTPPPSPVVVVTTSTLHSSWIALPNLNRPIMLVSSTSAVAQAVLTSAFIWTSPAKHPLEHVCCELLKSDTVQPGIVV